MAPLITFESKIVHRVYTTMNARVEYLLMAKAV